jgi:hypothetical protein
MTRSQRWYCLTLLLLAMHYAPAQAQDDYDATVRQFMSMLGDNKADEATDYLFSGNPWLRQSPDQIQNVKSQLSNLSRLVGVYKGHEKLLDEKIGKSYVYLVYIGLYERQPIRFKFAFYRPDGKWRFQNFSFDANFSDEVERLADQSLLTGNPK